MITVISNVIGARGIVTKGLVLGLKDVEIKGQVETSIGKIGQNTKRSSRDMKVTIIPIVISALGAVTVGMITGLADREISRQVETIQPTVSLRSARIQKRVSETWDLLSLKL